MANASPRLKMKPNVAYTRVGDFLLMAHPETAPTDEEWDRAVEAIREAADSGARALIVHTLGGGPNAAQRKKVAAMWEARGAMIDIAVTTPSAMVRGVITALNWFLSRPARAFATLREAMEEVGASPSQQPELIVAMEQLKDQVR